MKRKVFWGIHATPPRWLAICLSATPFVLLIAAYAILSDIRHAENPSDKILPQMSQMIDAVERYAFTEDKRTGEYLLWKDTLSSLKRIGIGVFVATSFALLIGLNMGAFRGLSALLSPFIIFISMIPPLALLPILFISFGIGELGKIALIILGIFPLITRDVYISTRQIPAEQIVKALTLGASELAVVYKIILPQILPRLVNSLRLSLGAAWLFLIAAEAIASTDGLGYRIFLVRRYLSMDVIIPYVIWITALGFSFDLILRLTVKHAFPWYKAD